MKRNKKKKERKMFYKLYSWYIFACVHIINILANVISSLFFYSQFFAAPIVPKDVAKNRFPTAQFSKVVSNYSCTVSTIQAYEHSLKKRRKVSRYPQLLYSLLIIHYYFATCKNLLLKEKLFARTRESTTKFTISSNNSYL